MREKRVSELLFVVQGGVEPEHEAEVLATLDREFTTGQNVYVCEFNHFLEVCLVLFAEPGRRDFLEEIGRTLDGTHADLRHREAWRDLLARI